MATNQVKPTNMEAGPLSMNKPTKTFFTSQIIIRTVAAVSALSATLIMITNKQSISLFGLQITAKYTDSSAFRFLVGVNAVAFVYSLLSLAFGFLLKSPLCKPGGHLFLLFDLVGTEITKAPPTYKKSFLGKIIDFPYTQLSRHAHSHNVF
ncbi:hypothetical protein AMTR_s00016p00177650 [Amborella trichopoda]|uniref:CASP-like protein n=1 Tax=Amborella trichopoda TaxID=13333 RepID=W1PGL9_AMBTC|nr:hypothetical protein AMTR_s00016p00177650 [Amborella trichopoda]